MSLKNLNKISKLILDSQNILIVSHYDPDGDAIGSSMGLYYSLKKIGKNWTQNWYKIVTKSTKEQLIKHKL